MFQEKRNLKGDLFAQSNSFDDILEYVVSVFNDIENELIPLEDESVKFRLEFKNYNNSAANDRKDFLNITSVEKRNDHGFPYDSNINPKDSPRTLGQIERDLVKVNNQIALKFESVKDKLLIIFSRESPEFIERILSINSPRQLLGLINRAFESIEDHYFGNLDLDASYIMTPDGYHYNYNSSILIGFKKVLETYCADYLIFDAKTSFDTVGAVLVDQRAGDLEIKGLAVGSCLRRQGIAGSLIDEVVKYAKDNNCALSSVVPEYNLPTQLLLQDNGFVLLKTYKGYFAGLVDGYYMVKQKD